MRHNRYIFIVFHKDKELFHQLTGIVTDGSEVVIVKRDPFDKDKDCPYV